MQIIMKYQLFKTLPLLTRVVILVPLFMFFISLFFGGVSEILLNLFLFTYMADKETEIQKLKLMNYTMSTMVVQILRDEDYRAQVKDIIDNDSTQP